MILFKIFIILVLTLSNSANASGEYIQFFDGDTKADVKCYYDGDYESTRKEELGCMETKEGESGKAVVLCMRVVSYDRKSRGNMTSIRSVVLYGRAYGEGEDIKAKAMNKLNNAEESFLRGLSPCGTSR